MPTIVATFPEVPWDALCSRPVADGWEYWRQDEAAPDWAVPPPAPPQRLISVQEFRSRFTNLEQAATVTSLNAEVKVLVFKLSTRLEPVDLDDPQVIAGVDLLIAQGITTPVRKAAILA